MIVEVAPVEREVHVLRGLVERRGPTAHEARVVHPLEEQGRIGLVPVGRAGADERHVLAVHLTARVDDAVDRAICGQRLGAWRRHVHAVRHPRVFAFEDLHRQALALVAVVEVVLAEHLGERVDVVRCGGRRAPRVVPAVPEQDVEVDPGEGGAARVDPGPVDVHLHEDLWHVVADLGAQHADRVPGGRLSPRDQLPVGRVRGPASDRVKERLADVAVRLGGLAGAPGRPAQRRRHGRRLHRAAVGQRQAALRERVRRSRTGSCRGP